MKKLVLVLIMCGLCIAHAENHQNSDCSIKMASESPSTRGLIAVVGSHTSILGSAGKNICVDANGTDFTIVYGPPHHPWNPMFPFDGIYSAHSTDMGVTWFVLLGTYNPFGIGSLYPGTDGSPNSLTNPGELYVVWQEDLDGIYVATGAYIDIYRLPHSEGYFMPCVGVNKDDPSIVLISGRSSVSGTNYIWITTDGGYNWSDTIKITDSGGAGHFRWGTGDYAFFTYHDDYMSDEYPYYVETTDGGYTWSSPATLPAITSENFYWSEFDCEVINDQPFTVHNDLDGVMQLFYPDPDTPGSPGAWNWTALDVDSIGSGSFAYQGTTRAATVIQYPSIAYDSELDIILVTYKTSYEITPPPSGWTDGNYLGGIVSIDRGRTWYPTRPLSGPLLQVVGGPVETAHRLVTINDTTHCYSTWTDAADGIIGFQYFELGAVLPIDLDGWNPGVAENDRAINSSPSANLTIFPSVVNHSCCISFSMSQPRYGSIKLFDTSGRLAKIVYNGYLKSGCHSYDITTSNLPNGIYMVVLKSDSAQDAAKLIKMR